MSAAKRDLYIEQGATFARNFTWYEAQRDPVTGVLLRDADGNLIPDLTSPVDLTGATGRMQVRKRLSSDPVIDATTANGQIILGGTEGTVGIHLPDTATDLLDFKRGLYDLEVVLAGGRVERVLQGRAIIDLNVTR